MAIPSSTSCAPATQRDDRSPSPHNTRNGCVAPRPTVSCASRFFGARVATQVIDAHGVHGDVQRAVDVAGIVGPAFGERSRPSMVARPRSTCRNGTGRGRDTRDRRARHSAVRRSAVVLLGRQCGTAISKSGWPQRTRRGRSHHAMARLASTSAGPGSSPLADQAAALERAASRSPLTKPHWKRPQSTLKRVPASPQRSARSRAGSVPARPRGPRSRAPSAAPWRGPARCRARARAWRRASAGQRSSA